MPKLHQTLFQATHPIDGRTITGKTDFLAKPGMLVRFKDNGVALNGVRELELATNVKGFPITREVVAVTTGVDRELMAAAFGNTDPQFTSPVEQGGQSSGQATKFAELEGDDLLDASITLVLAEDTELTSTAGKLKVRDTPASQELVGILRQHLPVRDAGSTTRVRVEYSE